MTRPAPEQVAWCAWAAERLGVPIDASLVEKRKAFLVALEQADLVPASGLRAAWILGSATDEQQIPPERFVTKFREHHELCLRADYEQFANQYWSMKPDHRRAEYDRLIAQTPPASIARRRLERLRRGLTLDALAEADSDPITGLAAHLQHLFILSPTSRPVALHALAHSMRLEGLSRKTRLLKKKYPAIVKLYDKFKARFQVSTRAHASRRIAERLLVGEPSMKSKVYSGCMLLMFCFAIAMAISILLMSNIPPGPFTGSRIRPAERFK